jgi:hypothetical protein
MFGIAIPLRGGARNALDVSRTFEKERFEKTLRLRLGLCKENKLNGLIIKFSIVGLL